MNEHEKQQIVQEILEIVNKLPDDELLKSRTFVKKRLNLQSRRQYSPDKKRTKNPTGQILEDRIQIVTKYINSVLNIMGKDNIDYLESCPEIARDYLLTDEQKNNLIEWESEIFKYFDKLVCNYYYSSKKAGFVVNIIRNLLNQSGYKLVWRYTSATKNGKSKTIMIYSIAKI